MSKTVTVLREIEVSNSLFCYNITENIYCPHFWCGKCFQGFEPEYVKKENTYIKPQECKNLLIKENLR